MDELSIEAIYNEECFIDENGWCFNTRRTFWNGGII